MRERELSVRLVKDRLLSCIYSSVRLEGQDLTLQQVKDILTGERLSGVVVDDVVCVLNMWEAWQFVLSTLDEPVNIMYLSQLNKICGNRLTYSAGDLRTVVSHVTSGDHTKLVSIPERTKVYEELLRLSNVQDIFERAVETFRYLAKSRVFTCYNKCLALLIANKILVSEGLGILVIPDDLIKEVCLLDFRGSLSSYLRERCFIECKEGCGEQQGVSCLFS